MQLHDLKPKTQRRRPPRVGRGGKRGKTSGRGTKGQLARAGRKLRPEWRDLIKKLPKRRGYRFQSINERAVAVNLNSLERLPPGVAITVPALLKAGVVKAVAGRPPRVKILAGGEISRPVEILGLAVSATARAKIEKAGGTIK